MSAFPVEGRDLEGVSICESCLEAFMSYSAIPNIGGNPITCDDNNRFKAQVMCSCLKEFSSSDTNHCAGRTGRRC